jgi:hypothetical protein
MDCLSGPGYGSAKRCRSEDSGAIATIGVSADAIFEAEIAFALAFGQILGRRFENLSPDIDPVTPLPTQTVPLTAVPLIAYLMRSPTVTFPLSASVIFCKPLYACDGSEMPF